MASKKNIERCKAGDKDQCKKAEMKDNIADLGECANGNVHACERLAEKIEKKEMDKWMKEKMDKESGVSSGDSYLTSYNRSDRDRVDKSNSSSDSSHRIYTTHQCESTLNYKYNYCLSGNGGILMTTIPININNENYRHCVRRFHSSNGFYTYFFSSQVWTSPFLRDMQVAYSQFIAAHNGVYFSGLNWDEMNRRRIGYQQVASEMYPNVGTLIEV